MTNRAEISAKLREVLGSSNVYFQPPENIKMVYPCIVYDLDGINSSNANDHSYLAWKRYNVTFITKDPDNNYFEALTSKFKYVRFDRRFKADGMYHDVYTIY